MNRYYRYCGTLFVFLAMLVAGPGLFIQAKAAIAQHLLLQAWEKTLSSGEVHKPWAWADTWPVAKIHVPRLNITMVVLEGASGEAMAFAPARLAGSARNAAKGITMLGGHRDTHLAFLQNMLKGDLIELHDTRGQRHQFKWSRHLIADTRKHRLAITADQTGLILVTCYPFNATQTGGPMRFIVLAEPVEDSPLNQPMAQTSILITDQDSSFSS